MPLEKNLESIFDSIFDTSVTIEEENVREPLSEQLQQVQNMYNYMKLVVLLQV